MGHEGRYSQLSPHLIPPALSAQLTIVRLLLHNSIGIPLLFSSDSSIDAELSTFSILIVPLYTLNMAILAFLVNNCLWKAISIANVNVVVVLWSIF